MGRDRALLMDSKEGEDSPFAYQASTALSRLLTFEEMFR